jgi:hypothetical protein
MPKRVDKTEIYERTQRQWNRKLVDWLRQRREQKSSNIKPINPLSMSPLNKDKEYRTKMKV